MVPVLYIGVKLSATSPHHHIVPIGHIRTCKRLYLDLDRNIYH